MVSSYGAISMPWRASTCQSNFRFCPTLRTPRSSSSGLSTASASAVGHLDRHHLAGEQAGAVAALAVDQRHVAGLVDADGKREAAQLRLHRIEAGGLGVDGDHAGVDGAHHPLAQPLQGAAPPRSATGRISRPSPRRCALRRAPAASVRRAPRRRAGFRRGERPGRRGRRSKGKLALAGRGGCGRLAAAERAPRRWP